MKTVRGRCEKMSSRLYPKSLRSEKLCQPWGVESSNDVGFCNWFDSPHHRIYHSVAQRNKVQSLVRHPLFLRRPQRRVNPFILQPHWSFSPTTLDTDYSILQSTTTQNYKKPIHNCFRPRAQSSSPTGHITVFDPEHNLLLPPATTISIVLRHRPTS